MVRKKFVLETIVFTSISQELQNEKKLNTNYLEKLFGVDLTMRKLNVVEKLLTK